MNEIVWHNRARKQIKKIPAQYRQAIIDHVGKLEDFPENQGLDVKELKGHQYGFRLRVGRYRVLFDHDGGIRIVMIQEVKKRDERTY
ncbi:MAG: cytotoxic translational repressor of toxin-antitoxin stability system [Desulfobulbaceae bacterium BRH_c16a]|nr:MAG: cytotoxic translational repressor of toxin-antitoxin stability system [Desulfobulbaceae bacterium BRH_c16a]